MDRPNLPFVTNRLILRTFSADDLADISDYYVLPQIQRYLDFGARDHGDVKRALNNLRNHKRLQRPGDALALAVVRRVDDVVIGHVILRWTDATANQAELRFVFNPIYGRQGYAREAVEAALELGFDRLGFHRMFARCSAKDEPAARLLRQVGMRLEAHFREHKLFMGEWDDELHFAFLDREWRCGNKVTELTRYSVANSAA